MAPETGNGDGETTNTVFIDTSLDTHLATIVLATETVSDLKKKIMVEHKQCFPAVGDIKIQGLKVKRRENFYHLSESLLVKNAFGATKKNWFLFVDASRSEQHGEVHQVKHDSGDQLALPWVTDSPSIDKHDSHADRPLNLSLVHGSPKIVQFVNQRVPSVDHSASGDSCKGVSMNVEEDRSCDDNHWTNTKPDSENILDPDVQEKRVNEEIKSKKRILGESSFEDALQSRPHANKKHKTERIEGNSLRYKSKSQNVNLDGLVRKPLDDKHIGAVLVSRKNKASRNNKHKGNSAHDQLAVVVPSGGGDVEEEILTKKNAEASKSLPDDFSLKEKSSGLVQKAFIGNEVSSTRKLCCERDAPGNLKGAKSSTKLNDTNKDAIDASQQDLGSTDQKFADERVDKLEDVKEYSSKQGPEMKLPESSSGSKRKKTKKSAAKNKDKSLAKHAVHEIHSTIPTPAFDDNISDEQKNDKDILSHPEGNEASEKKPNQEDPTVKEVEVSKPPESNRNQVHAEYAEDDSREDFNDTVGSKRKKKDMERSGSRNNTFVMKKSNDAERETEVEKKLLPDSETEVCEKTAVDALLVDHGQNDANLMDNEDEISKPTETNTSLINAEDITDTSKRENEKTDGKKRKKKKTKRSGARNEDNSVVKHADVDMRGTSPAVPDPSLDSKLHENVKDDKWSLADADGKEIPYGNLADASQVSIGTEDGEVKEKEAGLLPASEANVNDDGVDGNSRNKRSSSSQSVFEKTAVDDLHVDHGQNDANLINIAVEISKPTGTNMSQVNAEDITDTSKKENEKTDSKKRKKRKTKRSAAQNEDDSVVKHANVDVLGTSPAVPDPGLDNKLHENVKDNKSSLADDDGKDIPKENLVDASQASVGTEGGEVKEKEAELLQASEANMNEDGVDGKSRNKRSSTSQSVSLTPTEEQGNAVDGLQLNKLDKIQDGQSLDDGAVKKSKKAYKSSVKGRSGLRSNRQSTELESACPLPEETSKNALSSEISKVRTEGQDDVNIQANIPKDGSHEIDFKHSPVSSQQHIEVASVDNMKDVTRSEREKKPSKKTKVLVPPVETDSQRNRERYDSKIDGASQAPKSLSKNENKASVSLKKTPEASTDRVKDSKFPNHDQLKTPKTTRKIDAPRTSKYVPTNKRNKKPSPESSSSSSSESSGRSLRNKVINTRKSSLNQTHGAVKTSKKTAQVVKSSHGVKGLLNTRGAIFGDGSDESSADDNASVNSDTSTCTPSNNSSSSAESDSSLDSGRNGSSTTKRKQGGGKNITNSQSRLKSLSMADLLRSSSRFRKAKFTASQQMDDPESQPVDFVPESQPISKR